MLIEIILFYILHSASAPAWCYVLNAVAMFFSITKLAVSIGQTIHEMNPSEEDEWKA